jgi:hypothetical protein
MIHYHIWFRLRSDVQEAEALSVIHTFLSELSAAGSVAGFQLLRNSGSASKTKMLPLHALIEFASDTQFAAAFSTQVAQGIHTGLHGRVMALVSEFQVEVFRQIDIPRLPVAVDPPYLQACEI